MGSILNRLILSERAAPVRLCADQCVRVIVTGMVAGGVIGGLVGLIRAGGFLPALLALYGFIIGALAGLAAIGIEILLGALLSRLPWKILFQGLVVSLVAALGAAGVVAGFVLNLPPNDWGSALFIWVALLASIPLAVVGYRMLFTTEP